MTNYFEKAEGSDFSSLQEDQEFKKDLVRFFSGGRYGLSPDQMRKRGFDGLTKDFIEHMRGQDWNEVTAAKDLNYVLNKDVPKEGKEAFGRLMKAWDTSDSAGTGFASATGDFAEAILSAPSTYVGLGSFGLGKIASKAAGKATQIATRKTIAEILKREATLGAASGAVMGGGQAAIQGETREEVGDAVGGYEYDTKALLTDVTIGGTVGAVLGGASGYIGRGRQQGVEKVLVERKAVLGEEAKKVSEVTNKTLENAKKNGTDKEAFKIVSDLDEILSARAGSKTAGLKGRLDPDRVAKGEAILNAMTKKGAKADQVFDSGLSVETMRNIAAASVDLMADLEIREGERITETVVRKLSEGDYDETLKGLDGIRKKYGLSKDEFSLIYLAEASRAGQVLGFQSAIKGGKKITRKGNDVEVLFTSGASSISDEEMKRIASNAARNTADKTGKFVENLRDVDALRISLMTSQPATTMRNMRNAGILVATDLVDQINKTLYKGLFKGDVNAVKNFLPNATAILRGYSLDNTDAKIVRSLMLDEMPEQSKRLYNNAMRLETALEGNSRMAKAGRFFNMANMASDSVLKEGMFYGSLDRQFRDIDANLGEWLRSNKKLEDLPEGISIEKAIDEANRLTLQKDFKGDTSIVGSGTRKIVDINRKIPFLISTAAGVPFPRYLGNHLNMVLEYTPLVGEIAFRRNIIGGAEDQADRIARQMTGLMGIAGGYALANMRDGEVDYGSIKNELGSVSDMKPYLGSAMWHTWLGDRTWRTANGYPVTSGKELQDELADVFGGIPDFSFDFGIATGLVETALTGKVTEEFEKDLGNFISTFTMPAALARDAVGQFDYDKAGSPFVRDLDIEEGTSGRGVGEFGDVLTMQSTRMLPDLETLQYTQSFNGDTDIGYYRFSNPVAISKMNPLVKQITGAVSEPVLTGLEEEMNKANLKDWKLYNKNTAPNANVDYLLRRRLAKTMYKEFEAWRKKAPASERYGKTAYDDIKDPKDRAVLLESWISNTIRAKREETEDLLQDFIASSPKMSRGFVRNNYALKLKELGEDPFNQAALDLGYESAKDMITSSENVDVEVKRRGLLLSKVNNYIPLKTY